MNRIVTAALSAVMCVAASASPTDNLTVSSPDGLTVVTVSVVDGVPLRAHRRPHHLQRPGDL